jgi:hypothetical protein
LVIFAIPIQTAGIGQSQFLIIMEVKMENKRLLPLDGVNGIEPAISGTAPVGEDEIFRSIGYSDPEIIAMRSKKAILCYAKG